MALILNKLMSSQYNQHTKIIEAYRSKNFKKSSKDSRKHLYFRIKPDKSPTELIVSYNDLKDNFPYALIDFYEARIKEQAANIETEQNLVMQNQAINKNTVRKIIEVKQANNTKKSQKNVQTEQPIKIVLQSKEKESENTKSQLIYDYDKYLQENDHYYKFFHVLFSESQSIDNRYLKDLNKQDGGKGGKEEVRDVRRKKQRLNYSEE